MVEKNLIDMIGEMPSDVDKNTNLITEKNTKVTNNIREEKNVTTKIHDTKPVERKRHYVHSTNTVSNFIDTAEKIPEYMQELVAQRKRNMNPHLRYSRSQL
ncbi:hypothetical protein F5ESL0233_04645 [Lactobacillus sp. ESL0233]|uniref:hypothetical protein n=1 Tax=Lactobacillus sp. ESL0233 TaxID=2069354 RepID=UPI000EFB4987|nr:hypothetical protein [Lactobacillus sp. ESL0233]RMC41614.1 hypothetical protein F5ESL0233_04645 [Lactobacillus sp. ESL0233]